MAIRLLSLSLETAPSGLFLLGCLPRRSRNCGGGHLVSLQNFTEVALKLMRFAVVLRSAQFSVGDGVARLVHRVLNTDTFSVHLCFRYEFLWLQASPGNEGSERKKSDEGIQVCVPHENWLALPAYGRMA